MFGVFWSVRKSNSNLSNGKITIGSKTLFNRAAMRLRRVHRCLRTKYKIPFDPTVGRSSSIFEKKNRIELGIFFSKISDWVCCIFKNAWNALCNMKITKYYIWSRFRNVPLGFSITERSFTVWHVFRRKTLCRWHRRYVIETSFRNSIEFILLLSVSSVINKIATDELILTKYFKPDILVEFVKKKFFLLNP